MKTLVRASLIPALVLCALSANVHAQSPLYTAIGSSALTIELGEAAVALNPSTSCVWSTKTSGLVVATDTSTGSSLTDSGNSWVVWVPGSGNTCASNATPAQVYAFLQTDSVVGDRCLFNAYKSGGAKCSISYAGVGSASPAGLISSPYNATSPATPITEVTLPAAVASALSAATITAAATDIRPEDGLFATTRALTPCGSTAGPTGSIAPYLGLGYTNGSDIISQANTKFHVISFSLTSTYYVSPVGVDPILFFVHSTNTAGTGLSYGHTSSISDRPDISRLAVAQFLDGSVGTSNAINIYQAPANATPVTTWIREPLSGTYNTVEYNVPNTRSAATSQDVGVSQLPAQQNCSGASFGSNPLNIPNAAAGSTRLRAIGTGEEISQVMANNDSFGYAFWGTGNFAASKVPPGDGNRYLSVDGYDPLFTYANVSTTAAGGGPNYGHFPQAPADLQKIDFGPLRLGYYPVWSLLRLVTVTSANNNVSRNLALAAAQFSAVGGSSPDFFPYQTPTGSVQVAVERSHFAPPGITFSPTNIPANHGYSSGYGACTAAESGGDVGGVIIRINPVDQAYCADTGNTTGITGRRY